MNCSVQNFSIIILMWEEREPVNILVFPPKNGQNDEWFVEVVGKLQLIN